MTPAKTVQLLTIGETAARLRCSPKHVYRLIATGVLHATDIALPGSRKPKTRVPEDDVASYIKGRTRLISA